MSSLPSRYIWSYVGGWSVSGSKQKTYTLYIDDIYGQRILEHTFNMYPLDNLSKMPEAIANHLGIKYSCYYYYSRKVDKKRTFDMSKVKYRYGGETRNVSFDPHYYENKTYFGTNLGKYISKNPRYFPYPPQFKDNDVFYYENGFVALYAKNLGVWFRTPNGKRVDGKGIYRHAEIYLAIDNRIPTTCCINVCCYPSKYKLVRS